MQTTFLFDEQFVAQSENLTFHVNPAVKHPANPILLPGLPHQWDSLQVAWPGILFYDSQEKLFRLWYHGLNAVQEDRPRPGVMPWATGYAESTDGINWTKPELGFHTYRDRPTNLVGSDWDAWTLTIVHLNPDTSDKERRFLSIWKEEATFTEPQMPRVLATSADGKFWRREKVIYREPPPRHQMQDFWQLLYQPEAEDPDFRYIAYSQYHEPRTWDGMCVRHIGLHHGPDIESLHDADPPIVLYPEKGIDDELHFASVYKTGGNYIMLFESDRFSQKPIHGDLRLAHSSDGINFRRVQPHSPLVATGARGMWDENLLVTTSYAMQEVGDEIWIYYFGAPNVYTNFPGAYSECGVRGSLFYPSYLGLATLPRDRFAYAEGAGTLLTHPMKLDDGALWLNAEGDGISVTALSGEEEVGRGVLGNESYQTVYRKVEWEGGVPRGDLQLRITLPAQARLYSFGCETLS